MHLTNLKHIYRTTLSLSCGSVPAPMSWMDVVLRLSQQMIFLVVGVQNWDLTCSLQVELYLLRCWYLLGYQRGKSFIPAGHCMSLSGVWSFMSCEVSFCVLQRALHDDDHRAGKLQQWLRWRRDKTSFNWV